MPTVFSCAGKAELLNTLRHDTLYILYQALCDKRALVKFCIAHNLTFLQTHTHLVTNTICQLPEITEREGNGTPLQYSRLESPRDGGAWKAAVHGVAGSRARLSNFTFTFHFHALEKEMATHSSVLAWRIPGIAEPGGLSSMGSRRVGHD